jgi:ribulose-5-phosphate 4-epimerase/fuculose-1-phosphate aldolase
MHNRKTDLLLILKVISDYLNVCDANRTHNSVRLDDKHFSIHKDDCFIENLTYEDLVDLPYGNRTDDPDIFNMMYHVHSNFYETTDCEFFIHFHDPSVIAVANTDEGLLPISQESLHIINDVYHKKYTGLFDEDLSHDFSDVYNNENKSVILIQGHGGLVMGKDAQDTLLKCYMFIRACRIQTINNNIIKMPAQQFDEHRNSIVANNLYHGFLKYYAKPST